MKPAAIVMGLSAGGMNALNVIFSMIPAYFSIPIIIVQHVGPRSNGEWIAILNNQSPLIIKEADEKEEIKPGFVYFAPPNYHLLVEKNQTLSLTIDERVNYARPSIDVLFETAAETYTNRLVGVVLTGSNSDGAKGMKKIQEMGGITIVQDPTTADSPSMPAAVIASILPNHILPLKDIIQLLIELNQQT